jgi:O-antigen biosynthesis protein
MPPAAHEPNGSAGYYDQPRPEIVALVPAAAADVLDCGCGAGALGAELVRRGHRVTGIECDGRAAAAAVNRIDRVLTGRLEDVVPTLPERAFDCVICADVLEHLADPWTMTSWLAGRLRPGGCFVCSLPNVRHLGLLVDLVVRGRWAYGDSGVLDRTHLRFFTRDSARSLLEAAGLEVGQVTGKPEHYRGALGAAAVVLKWTAPDLLVAQWLLSARVPER